MSEIKFTTDGGSMQNQFKKASKFTGAIVIAILLLIVLVNSFKIVDEGFIGVKYRLGAIVSDNLSPGLNFHIPFIETIVGVDIRNQVYEVTTDAYTSDTQNVNELRMKLTYMYDATRLSTIIRTVGVHNVEQRFLVPNVARISKDSIGKERAENLVQNRASVQTLIEEALRSELAQHGIIVTAFAIENIAFDPQFEVSIQEKVIAEQEALRTRNRTVQREEEAKQVIIKAEADAKAIELIQNQLAQSPAYIEYLKVTNWNGILPIAIGDGINPFLVLGDTTNMTPTTRQSPQQPAAQPAITD